MDEGEAKLADASNRRQQGDSQAGRPPCGEPGWADNFATRCLHPQDDAAAAPTGGRLHLHSTGP